MSLFLSNQMIFFFSNLLVESADASLTLRKRIEHTHTHISFIHPKRNLHDVWSKEWWLTFFRSTWRRNLLESCFFFLPPLWPPPYFKEKVKTSWKSIPRSPTFDSFVVRPIVMALGLPVFIPSLLSLLLPEQFCVNTLHITCYHDWFKGGGEGQFLQSLSLVDSFIFIWEMNKNNVFYLDWKRHSNMACGLKCKFRNFFVSSAMYNVDFIKQYDYLADIDVTVGPFSRLEVPDLKKNSNNLVVLCSSWWTGRSWKNTHKKDVGPFRNWITLSRTDRLSDPETFSR